MSKQAVILRVPIDDAWDAGDRLQVYTDFGDGTIDTNAPLLGRPVEIFPGQQAGRGLGRQPVGRGRVGDARAARPRTGLGRTRLGRTPVGRTPAFMEICVDVPPAFGSWKFGIEVVDRFGNVQSAALQEVQAVVSGTEPAALQAFGFASYDGQADQATFNFTAGTE